MPTESVIRRNMGLLKAAPSQVRAERVESRLVYSEPIYLADVILVWPGTSEVRAQVAVWRHVVAARLLEDVRKANSDEVYEVGISGIDFLSIDSTRKQWTPILEALKRSGYKPVREKINKIGRQKRLTKRRFDSLRLKPELVPTPLFRRSLRNALRGDRRWRAIRKQVLETTGGICEICRAYQEKGMICHEKWDYDDVDHVATLTGFQLVCPDCNLVLHAGWSSIFIMETSDREPAKALELFMRRETHINRVNGITDEEKKAVYNYASNLHAERSKHRWRVKVDQGIEEQFPFLRGIAL